MSRSYKHNAKYQAQTGATAKQRGRAAGQRRRDEHRVRRLGRFAVEQSVDATDLGAITVRRNTPASPDSTGGSRGDLR